MGRRREDRIGEEDLPRLIGVLEAGSVEEQRNALALLCPCRNKVYDRDVWLRITNACDSMHESVAHQARHAIETLRNRSSHDARAAELVESLPALDGEDDAGRERPKKGASRIRRGGLSEVVGRLDEGTREERCRSLTLLCPCRNRVYDREVWARIIAARKDEDGEVRDRAEHAFGTLAERAFKDPRSFELLQDLQQQFDENSELCIDSIAMWGPRSRPSRRKIMTSSRAGRCKAQAHLSYSLRNRERRRD